MVGFRHIFKQPFLSFINIFGLTIGITSVILITLFIKHEISYDRFHEKLDRIYRINRLARFSDKDERTAVTPAPLAQALVSEISQVETATRIYAPKSSIIQKGDVFYTVKNLLYADSTFFQVFTYTFLQLEGTVNKVLATPNTIVLTDKSAKRFFGTGEALGKVLYIKDKACKVTGVIQAPPSNAHFHFDVLVSMPTYAPSKSESWGWSEYATYALLKPTASIRELNAPLQAITNTNIPPLIQEAFGYSFDEFLRKGGKWEYYAQPVADIHLYSNLADEIETNGDVLYIYMLSLVAVIIISIVCINFVNLNIARSSTRAKEVGVRKAVGATQGSLIRQFLVESVIVTMISAVLSILFAVLLLSAFNHLSGKEFSYGVLVSWQLLSGLIISSLILGIIAGSYPAFYLSSFRPLGTLKGKISLGMRAGSMRNGMVGFQFAISIILIICSTFVYRQVKYLRDKDLGFDKEHVIIISNATVLKNDLKAFRDKLSSQSKVISSSSSTVFPAVGEINMLPLRNEGTNVNYMMTWFETDQDFAETLDIKLIAGRYFSKSFTADSLNVVLNQEAVKLLGLKDPIGKKIVFTGLNNRYFQIIGVVNNFNFESLRNEVKPIVITNTDTGGFLAIRVRPDDIASTVKLIENTWRDFSPGEHLQYSFLNSDFEALFREETRLSKIFNVFTYIAVVIACLGLFALSSFMVQQRTKEISIRKAMGASTEQIALLLVRNIAGLVVLAYGVAVPVSYFLMDNWLQSYAFRTNLSIWVFMFTGIGILCIALLTISPNIFKAAVKAPLQSLRSD